jgi:hypothetical protein
MKTPRRITHSEHTSPRPPESLFHPGNCDSVTKRQEWNSQNQVVLPKQVVSPKPLVDNVISSSSSEFTIER